MKNIKFIIVSKDASFKMQEDAFTESKALANVSVEYISNNQVRLPIIYNKYLQSARLSKDIDYLVFMHADVSLNIKNMIQHIIEVEGKYDIIGLCGTSTMNVSQSPLNWWTGSNPTPYDKWGCVTHGELGDQTSYFSDHSPNVMDAEVACIDGLCIIFTKKSIETTDLQFDEQLSDFDFYDTDLSFQATMKYHLKIGVIVQKDLCHYSVGMSILSPKFLDSEEIFRKKWNLPIPPDSAIAKHLDFKAKIEPKIP